MANYDFSTINDKDFEEIVCDLLSAEHGIIYQSFKEGRDKGIDLRYSTKENENHTVVQVKHFLKSGKSALKTKLKNEEFRKAESLNVEKYIVVTSIGLSPDDKSKIKAFFEPYIQTTNDIYGENELNTLLGKHDKVETRHFKLWFTNTKVLDKIINNGIKGRSAFNIEKIKRNIGLFVKTQSFDDALQILQDEKVLLISGIPGIGKTSLSYMLIYKLLGEGFDLIYCDGDFKEAENVFDDSDSKQIFFFDDFLGDTYLEIKEGKNNKINDFIDRIRIAKNKLIILTTRTTIFQQAIFLHEKLSRADLDTKKFELTIKDYNEFQKAQILYNHVYFNGIDKELLDDLLEQKKYYSIINHKSYNPRLLEFITNQEKYKRSGFDSYYQFCIHNLNHPEEVWKHPVRNQLNHSERLLLYVLLSLGGTYEIKKLEKAFEETKDNTSDYESFKDVFKKLLEGYIKSEKRATTAVVSFINPSIKDYLIDYFNKESYERKKFFSSFTFLEQIENHSTFNKGLKFEIGEWIILVEKILKNIITSLNEISNSQYLYEISIYLKSFFIELDDDVLKQNIDEFIVKAFHKIKWDKLTQIRPYEIDILLDYGEKDSAISHYIFIIENFHLFLPSMLHQINDLSDLQDVFRLQDSYNYIDIIKTIENNNLSGDYEEALIRVYDYEADAVYYNHYRNIKNEHDLYVAEKELHDLQLIINDYFTEFSNIEFIYNPFSAGVNEIIASNSESEYQLTSHENVDLKTIENDIDGLFNRFI